MVRIRALNKERVLTRKEQTVTTEALAEAVRKAGGTQAALARLLGMSRAAVNQFLKTGSVSLRTAKLLESKLGISRRRTLPNLFN